MDAFAANQQAIATALLDPLAPIPTFWRTRQGSGPKQGSPFIATMSRRASSTRWPRATRSSAGSPARNPSARSRIGSFSPSRRIPRVLLEYAETFPDFLRSLGPTPSMTIWPMSRSSKCCACAPITPPMPFRWNARPSHLCGPNSLPTCA
jgi:hypothetical protein